MTAERSPGGGKSKAHSCAGLRRDGRACTAPVIGPQRYCYHHDPQFEQERRERASNAARSKGKPPRIVAIQDRIERLVDRVESGDVDPKIAQVCFTGLGVLIKAHEQARKNRETEELAALVEDLEEHLAKDRRAQLGLRR